MLRSSLTIAIVTLFVLGCSQPATPTFPSAVGPGASLAEDSSPDKCEVAAMLERLRRVEIFIANVNRRLELLLIPPGHATNEDPAWYFMVNFEASAVSYLDEAAPCVETSPPSQDTGDALKAIAKQANTTLGLLTSNGVPQRFEVEQIKESAQHIVDVATSLIICCVPK